MSSACWSETATKRRLQPQVDHEYATPIRHHRRMQRCRVLPDVVAKTFVEENDDPGVKLGQTSTESSAVTTPSIVKIKSELHGIRQQLEQRLTSSSSRLTHDKISPGLARLRMTPGVLKEKQRSLINQHEEIRQKGDQLKSGGGVALWPHMNQMRLTRSEMFWLLIQAVVLSVLTVFLLNELHGKTFKKLQMYAKQIEDFCKVHYIRETVNQDVFHDQIFTWHKKFLKLTNNIKNYFDTSAMSTSFHLYILTYLLGLLVLFYYLMDNMLANNKLTPARIKKWTCLLVVIGTWTGMMAYGLFLASRLEKQACVCVQQYSSLVASLVTASLDLNMYQSVLLYWRSRFLDNAAHGLLNMLGIMPINDVLHYLQFYSVPIVTVMLSPVIKLCCACLAVYKNGEYLKLSS